MKIKPEHFDFLKQVIAKGDTDSNRNLYVAAEMTDKRYRWDVLRYSMNLEFPGQSSMKWVCDNLYPYLNDDHIDTALRNIIKPLREAA